MINKKEKTLIINIDYVTIPKKQKKKDNNNNNKNKKINNVHM